VVLYFDLGSPYAYLAVARAGRVLGAEPELRPVLLGAIFQMRGWGSWSATDEREAGRAEVERRAAAYGLPPVAWPPDWPSNTLAAMRACVWAGSREFVVAAYRAAFVRGLDLGDVAVLREVALSVDLSPDDLEAAVGDPAVKAALKEATDAAWALGVRGVPTLEVDGKLLYGDDHLDSAIE
jgi:2-hydroxychromene-2-carboxylate isomerase